MSRINWEKAWDKANPPKTIPDNYIRLINFLRQHIDKTKNKLECIKTSYYKNELQKRLDTCENWFWNLEDEFLKKSS